MYFASVAGLTIRGNFAGNVVPTDGGAPRGVVNIGPGVSAITPWAIRDNSGMALLNEAGTQIYPWTNANFSEQLFRYTSEYNNAAWDTVLAQDGTTAPDGSLAWLRGSLSKTSSSPSTFSELYTDTVAGHQFGVCALLKATGGVAPFAAVYITVSGTGHYTGSATNQPSRVWLGSEWQWVCGDMTYPLSDGLGSVRLGFAAWAPTGSTATGIYVAPKMHGWMDSVSQPAFVATRNSTVRRGFLGYMGETVFSQLWAAQNGTAIVCADCTAANPTAGEGTGAFVRRIGGIWVGN
jgi:hypothetical protein